MTAFLLKLIALATMIVDHSAAVLGEWPAVLPPELETAMRTIGRAAFPIYAFLLVEGFHHTRDRRKYALRLLGLGVLSQLPYAFTINRWAMTIPDFPMWRAFTELNILFTLFAGLLLLCWLHWEALRRLLRTWGAAAVFGVLSACMFASGLSEIALACGGAAVLIAAGKLSGRGAEAGDQLARFSALLLALWLFRKYVPVDFDYGVYAFALFAALYWARTPRRCALVIAAWGVLLYSSLWAQVAVVALAAVLVACYRGKRGPNDHRLFYWAYPAHLFVLWGVAALLTRLYA